MDAQNHDKEEDFAIPDEQSVMQRSDKEFYFKVKRGENRVLSHVFWADTRSRRIDYKSFGDVVVIDTNRRLDEYNMNFVPFFGCGNHNNAVFFGCGIVSCDEDGAYEWLLSAFRESTRQICPRSVITDDNRALCTAVKGKLPESTHKICPIYMVRNAKKFVHAPNVMERFNLLVSEKCSPDTFEENFTDFAKNVNKNFKSERWLRFIYEWKKSWAGAFLNNEKFMGVSNEHVNKTIHSNLHKLLNKKMSLINSVLHYEHYLNKLRHDESYQDFKTSQSFPVCTTNYKIIEKFAAQTYAQSIFYIVKEEIKSAGNFVIVKKIETLGCMKYILCAKGDSDDILATVIGTNSGENLVLKCSCMKLEHEGIPCRHIFSVLIKLDLNFIPRNCICKKWTQNANKSKFPRTNELFRPWKDHMDEIESLDENLRRRINSDDDERWMFSTGGCESVVQWERTKKKECLKGKSKCGKCGEFGHNRQTCDQGLISGSDADSDSEL